jgi:hypothetical protein
MFESTLEAASGGLTPDEELRMAILGEAIRHHGGVGDSAGVVATAKAFEDYIRGPNQVAVTTDEAKTL